MNTHLNGNIYLQKNSQEINNSLKTTPLNLFNNVSFEESSYFPVEDNTHQIDLKNVNKSIGLSDEKIKSIKDKLSDFFQKSTIADGISDEEFKFIENFQNYFEYSPIETDGIKSDDLIEFNLKNFPILLTSGDEIKINLEYSNGRIKAKYKEYSIDTSSTIDKIVIYFGNGIKYLTKIEAGGDYLYLDEDSGQIYAILASTENSIKSNFIKVEDEQLIKSGSIAGNTEFKHVLGSESIYKKEADYYKLFQFNHKHYYVRIIYFNNFCAFYYNTNLNYHVSNSYITKFPFFLKGNMAKLEKDYLISIIKSIFIKDNQVKLQNIMNNDKSFIPMYCAHYIFLMVYMKDIIKDNDFLIKKIIINDNERYEEILKETNNLLESLKNNLLESLNNFSIPIVSRDKL